MEAAPGMHYSISGNIEHDVPLDPLLGLNLFRILQEAVHNTLKHSKAGNLKVSYQCTDNVLTARVEDNGVGFENGARSGHGQKTMVARAAEAGVVIEVQSAPGEGTVVALSVAVRKGDG